MHKGDATDKGLVCLKRDFSPMYDQTVTIKGFLFFKGAITVSKQRYKIYQHELHVSICINRLIKA